MVQKFFAALVVTLLSFVVGCNKGGVELLNVSYDPTRELYDEFNLAFTEHWKAQEGQDVTIKMSHGGSGKQARSVIDGLEADVVTLALAYDIDMIAEKAALVSPDWRTRLPGNSAPYTSTIVFLVRKGNPKNVKDWNDLVRDDVKVITPNPKTSGGARWNYLAAWGYSLKQSLKDLEKVKESSAEVVEAHKQAEDFVRRLFANVPVLDSGARGSTMTFVEREIGDVLLAWENEAFLAVNEKGADKFEIVVPSISILAEPPVTLVDSMADKHGTRKVAQAYLEYLYSPTGQTIAAKHYYRPTNVKDVPDEHVKRFPKLELFTVDAVFGGWKKAQPEHFDDGGIYDRVAPKH